MSTGRAPMFFSSVAQSPPAGGSQHVQHNTTQLTLIHLNCGDFLLTLHVLHHHAEVPPGLEGAEHGDDKRVLGERQDVSFHEGLLDLVPQDQVLLVDLLHGETLPSLFVTHQKHGAKQRRGFSVLTSIHQSAASQRV